MSKILPINLRDLLLGATVESERIEFKATWDPERTGPQIVRTVCAFANDFHRINGGYIVVGVAEREGASVLPPTGLARREVEAAQRWIAGQCARIRPPYQPVLAPETFDGRHVLVVWAPGSDVGGHRAPEGGKGSPWRYWVRLGAETVDAERRGLLSELLRQAARTPWDDRLTREALVEDIGEGKVREHLHAAGSGLLGERDTQKIYRRMRIVGALNGRLAPRNVGLLMFAQDPCEWFLGARIEVTRFAGVDRAGDVQDEQVFRGGVSEQVRDCLRYLENMSGTLRIKNEDRPEATNWKDYPSRAVREVLVNAVTHRSYEEDTISPTKIDVFTDRMVVTSYPGPVPGINAEHFAPDAEVPFTAPRNRRIGEFMKELRLAELLLSGIPKIFRAMEANGSPPPEFKFDEGRNYFQVILRAHPMRVMAAVIRDVAELRATGRRDEANRLLERVRRVPEVAKALAEAYNRAELDHLPSDLGRVGNK